MRQFKVAKRITSRGTESIDKYLSEISRFPVLTVKEEEDFAMRAMKGDRKAKEMLINCNLRFVVSVAKGYQISKFPLEDLINEGNEGLIIAADHFDPTRGFKFISYAVWWIRQKITAYIQQQGDLIQKPFNITSIMNKMRNADNKEYASSGNHIDKVEFLEDEGYNEKAIKAILDADHVIVKGDTPISPGENETTYFELFNDGTSADDSLFESDRHVKIVAILKQVLNSREFDILIKYYGIGCESQSLDEIALHQGLTRERVRQINIKALSKLRHRASSVLREYR